MENEIFKGVEKSEAKIKSRMNYKAIESNEGGMEGKRQRNKII